MPQIFRPQKLVPLAAVVAGLLLLAAPDTFASGSYAGGPPTVPKPKQDNEQFQAGQAIFNGKAQLAATDKELASGQLPRLQTLERTLESRAGIKKDLSSLAGRLTEKQLESLALFINTRYKGE